MNMKTKDQLDKIKQCKTPLNYQRTMLGYAPCDWEKHKIGQCLQLETRTVNMQDNESYLLLTVRRDYNGVKSRGKYLGKDILVKTQFEVRENDFVISKRQISFGACGLVPKHLSGAIVSNEYNVFTPKKNIDICFFNYLMHQPRAKNLFFLMSDGVHIEKMLFKTKDWLKQSIAIPSTIIEQQKIVEILAISDKMIELRKKLIEELENRKEWLMQNLLTGRVRLKGFACEWKQMTLGNIFKERAETNCSDLQLLAITSSKGVIPRTDLDLKDNSSDDKRKYKKICIGDIGYNTMRMWQGVCAFSNYEGIVSPAYTILRPVDKIEAKFFAYLFKTAPITFLFYRFSQGLVDDTRNLKYSSFKKLKVFAPKEKEEQFAIANILCAADHEIDSLRHEMAEWENKRKVLMQLLLTGIVRVKI